MPNPLEGDNSGAYFVGRAPLLNSFTSELVILPRKASLQEWGLPAVHLRSYHPYRVLTQECVRKGLADPSKPRNIHCLPRFCRRRFRVVNRALEALPSCF